MKRRFKTAVLLAVPIAGLGLTTAGCYTRTVDSKGVGAEFGNQTIYEPNLKINKKEGDSMFDGAGDLLLGPRRIEERR